MLVCQHLDETSDTICNNIREDATSYYINLIVGRVSYKELAIAGELEPQLTSINTGGNSVCFLLS